MNIQVFKSIYIKDFNPLSTDIVFIFRNILFEKGMNSLFHPIPQIALFKDFMITAFKRDEIKRLRTFYFVA